MYTLKKDFLDVGHECRPGGSNTKNTITIHSTANPKSTAQNERKWLDNPTNTRIASWHYVVGEGEVIQAIPDGETAYHCGNSTGNVYSLGIEIVESGDRSLVLLTAAEFVADKLKELKLTPDALRQHFNWSGKNCPRILRDKTYIQGNMDWEWFVKVVKMFYNGEIVEYAKMKVNGKYLLVRRILKDGTNYIAIRDIAETLGFDISNEGNVAVLTKK